MTQSPKPQDEQQNPNEEGLRDLNEEELNQASGGHGHHHHHDHDHDHDRHDDDWYRRNGYHYRDGRWYR